MKFLYPEFLWAFAVLIIPVIIHLFNFKRYKTLYFSSLNFIRQVDQKTKSTHRLKHLLVLCSRLLAFSFLVLAFAQPYFPNGGKASEAKKNIMAFYIDNSFSMQARGADGELLSQARENVRNMIQKAPMDTRFIIGTNQLSGSEERLLSKIEALEKLDQIELSPIQRSPDEILSAQLERLNDEEIAAAGNSVQYIYLSDFQSSNGLEVKQHTTNGISFFPIKLSPEVNANLFIDSVWYSSPLHKVNTQNELNIRILNSGKEALENVEVQLDIAEYHKTLFVNLPPNERAVTVVSYSDKSTGKKQGNIQVMDNHVLFDDAFYVSYEVRENIELLTLNGEDAIANIATVYDLDDFYQHQEQAITAITKDDFQGKDLVIINGANELSRGVANYILEFVETGGSVGLFPGKNPNRTDWNFLLGKLRLAPLGNAVNSGNKIKTVNYEDPFFEGVFETNIERLNLPSVASTFRAISNNASLNASLVQLQNGLPLFASAKTNGTAYLLYSSLHEDFGNFSKNALFSTLLLRMGELSQRSQPDFVTIGKQTRYPIYKTVSGDESIHIVNEDFDFIPQLAKVSGVTYLSLNMLNDFQQLKAGTFDIRSGNQNLGNISLNYNRAESLLASYDEPSIVDYFTASGFKQMSYNEIGAKNSISTIDIDKPFSYWKICIILTLIFVTIEMLLIRFLK